MSAAAASAVAAEFLASSSMTFTRVAASVRKSREPVRKVVVKLVHDSAGRAVAKELDTGEFAELAQQMYANLLSVPYAQRPSHKLFALMRESIDSLPALFRIPYGDALAINEEQAKRLRVLAGLVESPSVTPNQRIDYLLKAAECKTAVNAVECYYRVVDIAELEEKHELVVGGTELLLRQVAEFPESYVLFDLDMLDIMERRGFAYVNLKRHAEAMADFVSVDARDPMRLEMVRQMAHLCVRSKQYVAAIRYYTRVAELETRAPKRCSDAEFTEFSLATVYCETGQFAEALARIRRITPDADDKKTDAHRYPRKLCLGMIAKIKKHKNSVRAARGKTKRREEKKSRDQIASAAAASVAQAQAPAVPAPVLPLAVASPRTASAAEPLPIPVSGTYVIGEIDHKHAVVPRSVVSAPDPAARTRVPEKADHERAIVPPVTAAVARDVHGCVVCLDAAQRVAFIPCGHICCCEECSAPLDTCPVCRASIQSKLRIFHA